VAFVREKFAVSERRACKLFPLDRSTYRYEPRPDHNAELREEMIALARQKPRYGYRRLHAVLERRGQKMSRMRLFRLYQEAGLAVRRRRRKRLTRPAAAQSLQARSNQEWALDFVSDTLGTGRGFRMLTVVDAFTRECLGLDVDTSLSSRRVTRELDRIIEQRGKPESIRCDNVLNASLF
jgi:putative transposase